jgi:hypothetical protein
LSVRRSIVRRIIFSSAFTDDSSSGVTKLIASPIACARPVRPMRWT